LEKEIPFARIKSIRSEPIFVCSGLIGKLELGIFGKAKLRITVNCANGTSIGLQKMGSPLDALLLRVSDDAEHRMLAAKRRLDRYPKKAPFRNKVYVDKRNWNAKDIRWPGDACPEQYELGNEFVRWQVKISLFHLTDSRLDAPISRFLETFSFFSP
jgi:hypothetical protein